MSFKAIVSLLIFCLDVLSIDVKFPLVGVKFPLVLLHYCQFFTLFVDICIVYLGAPMLSEYVFIIITSSCWIDSFFILNVLLCSLCLKVSFV